MGEGRDFNLFLTNEPLVDIRKPIADYIITDRSTDLGTSQGETQALIETRRAGRLDVMIGNENIVLAQQLGSGGSKEVYDAEVGGVHYALAIPGTVDDAPVTIDKWKKILNEPANTARFRELGFYANRLCELVKAKINEIDFPALIMQRYEDLPFEVRDSKNPKSSVGDTRIIPKGIDVSQIPGLIQPLAGDIKGLLTQNVKVGSDAFNLAVVNGRPRIYFNDLGGAKFESLPQSDIETVTNYYITSALAAFVNGLTEAEYQEYKGYFDNKSVEISEQLRVAVAGY